MNAEYYEAIRTNVVVKFNDSESFEPINFTSHRNKLANCKTLKEAKSIIAANIEMIAMTSTHTSSIKFEEKKDGDVYWLIRLQGNDGTLGSIGIEYKFKIIKKETT